MEPLNIFYSEPDPDRWFKYDHYIRKIIRRIVRGKQKPGGVMMVALNLMKGLDKLGTSYRFNNYKYIKQHPNEIACIIGKPHIFFDREWKNPVIFGAGIYSHPIGHPDLLKQYPNIKRFIVPGQWMRKMFEPYYGDKVTAWPVGIDTDIWQPSNEQPKFDFLIYDKIRWDHDIEEERLLNPIKVILQKNNLTWQVIKYGDYKPSQLATLLKASRASVFLCEHETQGLAYQQILATGTPILAWDRGGYWQDPQYFPTSVKYQPVSAVPYWDDRCGIKFENIGDFEEKLLQFLSRVNDFKPRNYILENLTLEICARKYLYIVNEVKKELQANK